MLYIVAFFLLKSSQVLPKKFKFVSRCRNLDRFHWSLFDKGRPFAIFDGSLNKIALWTEEKTRKLKFSPHLNKNQNCNTGPRFESKPPYFALFRCVPSPSGDFEKKRIFTYLTSPYCIILSSDVSRRYYAHSSLGCPYILAFIFIPGYLVPLDNAHTAPKRYYRWKWWCGLVSTRITLIASPVTSASTDSASATSFSSTFRWYFARLITMTSQAFSTSTTWLTMCDFRWFLPWSWYTILERFEKGHAESNSRSKIRMLWTACLLCFLIFVHQL